MKITDEIKIDWHHNIEKKSTACVLTVNDREFIAVAKCGHDDQFNRVTGRKLTLSRVLKIADLNRDLRTIIWNTLKDKKVRIIS